MHNVFVLGLNDFNACKLRGLPRAAERRFHGVLEPDEVRESEQFPIAEMIHRARNHRMPARRDGFRRLQRDSRLPKSLAVSAID